jgi:hypothetical protein
MYEGHVVGVLCSGDFDITNIGLMMTGTLPQDLPPEQEAPKDPAPGSASAFDEVLDHVKDYEQIEQAIPPAGQPVIITEEELPPAEDSDAGLSEKERVLRKVLGKKYAEGDEE